MVKQSQDEDRVSLAPLDPEEALRALLGVKPEDPPETKGDASGEADHDNG